jgi:hypothetical protein
MEFKKLLQNLQEVPHRITMENRPKLKYKTFGVVNQAEFPYINSSDNMPWDAVIPGYKHTILKKEFYTNTILAILLLSNGNHKLFMKISHPGYTEKQAKRDMDKYKKQYKKYNPHIKTMWIR